MTELQFHSCESSTDTDAGTYPAAYRAVIPLPMQTGTVVSTPSTNNRPMMRTSLRSMIAALDEPTRSRGGPACMAVLHELGFRKTRAARDLRTTLLAECMSLRRGHAVAGSC